VKGPITGYLAINSSYSKELLEKFIVFDDELVIGPDPRSIPVLEKTRVCNAAIPSGRWICSVCSADLPA
jgi:hypothetical protein